MNNKAPKPLSIPKPELCATFNSLFSERRMNFERRLSPTGDWEWRAKLKDGTLTGWDQKLFDFAGNTRNAITLLDDLCRENDTCWDLQFDVRNQLYRCEVTKLGEERRVGGPPEHTALANAVSDELTLSILFVLAGIVGFDVPGHHRVLFPMSEVYLKQ